MDNNRIIMEDTSGFYKLEDDNWLYAPNFVYGPNYELLRENKDSYTYPVEGWEWYDESPIEESFIEDAVIVEDLNSL
jgi:hypothetical protein